MDKLIISVDAVIFLDIDGVLHPALGAGLDALGPTFEEEQLSFLKEVCSCLDIGVKIVLTSNWRKYPPLVKMADAELKNAGISGGVFDVTDVLQGGGTRQMEICKWLKNYEPEQFVIIDDLNLADESIKPHCDMWEDAGVVNHFIRTDYTVGLTRSSTDKCIDILRNSHWSGIDYCDGES